MTEDNLVGCYTKNNAAISLYKDRLMICEIVISENGTTKNTERYYSPEAAFRRYEYLLTLLD